MIGLLRYGSPLTVSVVAISPINRLDTGDRRGSANALRIIAARATLRSWNVPLGERSIAMFGTASDSS